MTPNTFLETLKVSLSLKIKNNDHVIPGANVKQISVRLFPYGFEAKAEFWISLKQSQDTLYSDFILTDLIEARMAVEGVYNLPKPKPEPLLVQGLVTQKYIYERTYSEIEDTPIMFRRYTIYFRDAASVLWRQHFPTALWVDAKMSDVIKAQVVKGVSMNMAWDVLETVRPLICLSLGDCANSASFYDFIIWFTRENNGIFRYDSNRNGYTLTNLKSDDDREIFLIPREISELNVRIPEIGRHDISVLNAYSDSPKMEEIPNTQSVFGIRRDVHRRAPISSDFDKLKTLETARLQRYQNQAHEIEIAFTEFPAKTFRPWIFASLKENEWSTHLHSYGKKYRIYETDIRADAVNPDPEGDLNLEQTQYNMEMTARLESKDNPWVFLPEHVRPSYPVRVEGKIVSEVGEQPDKTYQIYTDKTTSQDNYTVNIPLWNKNIRIPYEPGFFAAHFYFPAYKHTRVLVDLHFDEAEIMRYLDWGPRVRIPMDSQGNHLLLGKNATAETSIRHVFEDSKPVMSVKRVFGKDTELIKMQEGTLILQTMEEESVQAAQETYNMVPQVESARAQLATENRSAVGGVTADFEAAKTNINGQINDAVAGTSAELEAMDAEVNGKVNQINAQVEAAMRQMSEKTGEVKSVSEKAKAELLSALEL